MAKPETVRYEVKCQQEHVATYERKFDPAMQFTQGKEASLDPVGDALLQLKFYKEKGRVTHKEMDGVQMIVHLQAYPLNRPAFNPKAKVKGTVSGIDVMGQVLESKWSVEKKEWLYRLSPDNDGNSIPVSKEWVSEDLLKSVD